MELIDKSAVVAEIENKIKKYTLRGEESDFLQDGNAKYWGGVLSCLNEVKTFIDTLEVKEVDLESELKEDWLFADKTEVDCLECMCLTEDTFVSLAKKYFELGLKQSSSDEYKIGESEIYLDDNDGEPPYDCEHWLDLSCKEYEIPHDKFEVGDKIEIVIRKIKKGETK